jgi:hypothetical protein
MVTIHRNTLRGADPAPLMSANAANIRRAQAKLAAPGKNNSAGVTNARATNS